MQFSNELLKNFKDERINIFIYGNKKLVMKKILLSFVIIVSVIATIAFASNASALTQADTDYLRIHVRANSNEQIDQSIKYIVKDKVVEFITPYAAQCTDKQTAITVIGGILDEIEDVCDRLRRFDFGKRYLRCADNRTRHRRRRQLVVRYIPSSMLHLRNRGRSIPLRYIRNYTKVQA